LLAGDRSLTNVVAHEITHSWAGNLVTNNSWRNFWLNEGFTVYIERIILGRMNSSVAYRHFEALCGYNDLIKTVDALKDHPEFTKLLPNLDGIDPDDAFSKVPYEKGSLFLLFLESKVGGEEAMVNWLRAYFAAFRTQSVSTEQMKGHFLSYFAGKVDKKVLDGIDWDTWLNGTGLPPLDPRQGLLDLSLGKRCEELAAKWKTDGGVTAQATDLEGWKSKQIMLFLDLLITTAAPLSADTIKRLEKVYHFEASRNVEIAFRWLMLGLKSNYLESLPAAGVFLSKHGRGLYVRPLYTAVKALDKTVAVKTFEANKNFYHSVIRNAVTAILAAP